MNREIVSPGGGAGIYPLIGDVTSQAGNNSLVVTGLQGITISSGTLADQQFLIYSASTNQWTPTNIAGAANLVFATAASGGAANAALRALVPADLPTATSSTLGIVEPDNTTISISAGTITAITATSSTAGISKPDNATVTISAGVLSVPTATASLLGLVKPDAATISITSGLIKATGTFTGLAVTATSFTATATVAGVTGSFSGTVTAANLTATSTLTAVTGTFTGSVGVTGNVTLAHIIGGGTAPTIAAGPGAGTTPTITVSGSDTSGTISILTGTSPTASAVLATVTFAVAFGSAPNVMIFSNSTTAAIAERTAALSGSSAPWISATTTGFTINSNTAALPASTQYQFGWMAVQP